MSFFSKKWKMYLYLNGICVGKIKIKPNEEPDKNTYIVHFWFKKQIFKSNHVKSLIHPTHILKTEEEKRCTHWLFEYEKGIEV